MISATRRWLRRNRTAIAVGAGVIGGVYLAGQYVVGKINEARERMQMDKIAKENLRQRFQQNQTDCTITVLALLPTLTENILEALPVEQLTHELQQKKAERLARVAGDGTFSEASSLRDGDAASLSSFQTGSFVHASQMTGGESVVRRSKAQIWNELKISSITRAFTLIYSLSLLTLLTRIQLNLLSRLDYLSSVVSMAQPPPSDRANSIVMEDRDDADLTTTFGNDFETNRRYLTFSWYLLHRGSRQIMARVRAAVEEVFGNIPPTEPFTAQRLQDTILTVRKHIEGSTEQERYSKRWLPYMLPPREEEESVLIESGVITPPPGTPPAGIYQGHSGPNRASVSNTTASGPLRQLLDETADLIDSPAFTRLHTLLLNSMISHLIDIRVISQSFPTPPAPSTQPPDAPQSTLFSNSPMSPSQQRIQDLDSAVTIVPAEPRVKLANILAILTRQAHVIGNGNNPPNEYVSTAEEDVRELEAFAAVIYASNLNQDGIEDIVRPRTVEDGDGFGTHEKNRQSQGVGVSEVGVKHVDEVIEGKLESAWDRVVGTTFSSRS